MVNIFRPSTWLATRRESEPLTSAGESITTESRDDQLTGNKLGPTSNECTPIRERIEKRAYALWCEDGCPEGRDEYYWLQAERQILDETNG